MNTKAEELEFEEEDEGQEQELQVETQESLENEAKLMGWVPEAQFKGPKDHWISAEEFVDKGRHVMPILLANNKRLQKELLTRDAKLDTLATKLTTAQKTLGKLEGHYAEATTRAVAAAKKDLMAQLQLSNVIDIAVSATHISCELTHRNARRHEQEGDPGELVRPASKVETGSNRGSNSSRGTGRSFADLPSDAKQACWNDVDDLVGPDKTFKTKSEWEKEYTRIYYGMTQ